ncbi:hypothetical protein ACFQ3Z_28520 [Streptomyces nogalater]
MAAAFAGTVALGTGVGLWASADGGSGPPGQGTRQSASGRVAGTGTGPTAPGTPSAAPSPSRSYPLSKAPRTIPAVRSHTPERGPGWRPRPGARVVVTDPALADEGRLTAGELGLVYAGQKNDVRAGDVRLALGGGGGNRESYTLTVRDGRVDISGPGEAGSSTAPAP